MSITPVSVPRAYAIGTFRWSVFFILATAAFAQRDEHTGTILATLVFLIDVVSWNISAAITHVVVASSNQQWHSTLSDRFIFEKLLDRFRDRQTINFQEITREGTRAATEDINQYIKDNIYTSEWGGFRKTLLGIGYFLWYWISYGIFYGLAAFLGAFIRNSG